MSPVNPLARMRVPKLVSSCVGFGSSSLAISCLSRRAQSQQKKELFFYTFILYIAPYKSGGNHAKRGRATSTTRTETDLGAGMCTIFKQDRLYAGRYVMGNRVLNEALN